MVLHYAASVAGLADPLRSLVKSNIVQRNASLWQPGLRSPPREGVYAATTNRRADIVSASYLLNRLNESGAIESSQFIHAETIAEALKLVIDLARQGTYELWLGESKIATIEAASAGCAVPQVSRASWLGRLFNRQNGRVVR